MPPRSASVPIINPGTSWKKTSGMLNVSQSRTNSSSLVSAGTSRTPARCIGWLATTPTDWPSSRARGLLRRRRRRRQHGGVGHVGEEALDLRDRLLLAVDDDVRASAGLVRD